MTDIDPTHQPDAALPRWARDPDQGMAGGVAAGLAGAVDIDVAFVRIAFVVTGLLHGAGVLAYLAGWIALPSLRRARTGERERWLRERRVAGALLAAVALLVLAAPFDLVSNLVLPVLLLGVGVALWRHPVRRSYPLRSVGPPAGSSEPPAGPPAELPSNLGRLTVGVAVLAEGAALLLDRAGVLGLTAGRAASLALVVLGLGLLAGTVAGRARWLALPALMLVPVTAALVTFDRMGLDAFAPWTSDRYTAATAAEIPALTSRGVGVADVDLSAVDLSGSRRSATVESAVGGVKVWVPVDATVVVDADAAIGSIDLGSVGADAGVNRHLLTTLPGKDGAGTLHLRLRTGLGLVQVARGRPDDVFVPLQPLTPSPSPVASPGPG